MTTLIDISRIKRDADDIAGLPSLLEKAQAVVDRVYPGHKIVIVCPQEQAAEVQPRQAIAATVDFLSQNGVRQMQVLLRERAMTVSELCSELTRRGSNLSKPTVQSTLSRKKDLFKNDGSGKWSAVDVFSTLLQ